MKKTNSRHTLEESILILRNEIGKESISIRKILQTLSGNGKSLLLIILSLPFCQPIQIPGFSTPFGLAIMMIGFRMAFSKKVLLPKKILNYEVKPSTLKKIIRSALWWLKKINPFIHPRFHKVWKHPSIKFITALTIAFLGIFLALPLPIPFSNILAAWAIVLISLGTIKHDGFVILLGFFLAMLTAFLLIFLAFELFTHTKNLF